MTDTHPDHPAEPRPMLTADRYTPFNWESPNNEAWVKAIQEAPPIIANRWNAIGHALVQAEARITSLETELAESDKRAHFYTQEINRYKGLYEAAEAARREAVEREGQLQVQLAGCSVAAFGYGKDENDAKPGMYGWSQSYEDVKALYARCAAAEADALNQLSETAQQRVRAVNAEARLAAAEAARREAVERAEKAEALFGLEKDLEMRLAAAEEAAIQARQSRVIARNLLMKTERAKAAAEADAGRVRTNLEKYGDHLADCRIYGRNSSEYGDHPCSCGLEAALAAAAPETVE